jgi:hypothetical protein
VAVKRHDEISTGGKHMSEENDEVTIEETQAPAKPVDVDATWDGKGSLDEHRQKELAKLTQPGFGDAGKVKTDGE